MMSTHTKRARAVGAMLTTLAAMGPHVQATAYTWMGYDNPTARAAISADWAGVANWNSNGVFVSDAANDLQFFDDSDSTFTYATGSTQLEQEGTLTITNVPAALSVKSLTFDGRGPNATPETLVVIGDAASTWTIGDGATGTITQNAIAGGGGDRYVNYTVRPDIRLNQNTTFTGNGGGFRGLVFTGNISETAPGYGLTKSGSHRLLLYGSSSYTGPTTLSGGTLRLGNAAAVPGGLGASGGTSALTIDNGVLEMMEMTFLRNAGPGSDQFRITGGSSGFGAKRGPVYIAANDNAATELVWGSADFSPSTLLLNTASAQIDLQRVYADTIDAGLTLANHIDLNGATRTVQVNVGSASLSGDILTSSGTAGLTKKGGGTLILSGANTYNGTTTINGGTLSVGEAGHLGNGGTLEFNSGTLQIRGTTLSSVSGINATGHAVTFAGNVGFDIDDAPHAFTVDQVLNQGSGQLYKYGAGTLILNQANTYTGNTHVYGGALVLDYTAEDNAKISANRLYLGGGNLVLRGGTYGESVSQTYINTSYTDSLISRDGGTATIDLKDLVFGTYGMLGLSEEGIATTTEATTYDILYRGYVTVGSHFATVSAGDIVAYSAYASYSDGASGGSRTTVGEWTGGGSLGGTVDSYALRIANAGNSDVLNTTGFGLRCENVSTILYAGGWDDRFTITGTGGLRTQNGNQPIGVNVYTGVLTVDAPLASGGASTLVKSGAGTLVVEYSNTYTGPTYVQGGVLRLANDTAAGAASGGIQVQPGATLELTENITIGTEALTISGTGVADGGALRNISGDNAYGGDITVVRKGLINSDSGTLDLTGDIVAPSAEVAFGGAGNTTISNGTVNAWRVTKDGSGVLDVVVNGSDNQWISGNLALNEGTLRFTFDGAPSQSVAPVKILGDMTLGASTVISVEGATIASGQLYPLLTVAGDAPTTTPTLTGVSGGALRWGGPNNKTLSFGKVIVGSALIVQ